MANDVSGNPLILDTANTSAVVDPRGLIIDKFRWVGATTAGHQAVVKDGRGKVIFDSVADAANFVDESHDRAVAKGLIMHTLASGKIYIYYR